MSRVWILSDKVLENVTGYDERDVRQKQDRLRKEFIGKELKLFYSPRFQTQVYRIGHTNRVITENEFKQFVASGMAIQVDREKNVLHCTSDNLSRQLGITQDTADIPISEPKLDIKVETSDEIASKLVGADASQASPATKQSRRRHLPSRKRVEPRQAVPQPVASSVSVPASPAVSERHALDTASFVLGQTSMMQAIDDSDFFDAPVQQFKPFEPEKSKGGIMERIRGVFKR